MCQFINVALTENFLSTEIADQLLNQCQVMFEKTNLRSCHLFGHQDLIYKTSYYNKKTNKEKITFYKTNSWETFPELLIVKEYLEKLTGFQFNFCAVMMYSNENVVIKKHRDKEIPSGSTICGISIGATRRMQITFQSFSQIITLIHGSLYRLLPPTNDYCFHEILPETEKCDVRYSFTFRSIPDAMHDQDIKYCSALLKSGKRKGQPCGKIVYQGEFCGIHQK